MNIETAIAGAIILGSNSNDFKASSSEFADSFP